MGAALHPCIADEGWAGFRGAEARGGRGESAKVVADESQHGRKGELAGRERSQPRTSVIRLSRVGKKIAGSVLVMAEDEKTRELNKKTCVAHALCLIGCVLWITLPRGAASLENTHTHTHASTH